MKKYLQEDNWKIIENSFIPELHPSSESLFSLGNGHMGQRANFEEHYSGESLQGNYLAGVYYPDKTKVGWWKNGYPEYFAKVLNAPSWIGIDICIDGEQLDLNRVKVTEFERVLDMKQGLLKRRFTAELSGGRIIHVRVERFLSMKRREVGAFSYELKAVNFSGEIQANLFLDADVSNRDSNYDEKFWDPISSVANAKLTQVTTTTKKTNFQVTTAQRVRCWSGTDGKTMQGQYHAKEKVVGTNFVSRLSEGSIIHFEKIAVVTTSRDHAPGETIKHAQECLNSASNAGFEHLKKEQVEAWAGLWEQSDIQIEGDLSAQQGIRFNIFQLNQTYTGHDARLNIGPKGFTGEKYGGSTYWDTEAYCLPFYLSTTSQEISRNLLLYRYKHLEKAIENAEKLGFTNGAALYPMVTMNGEECHNEWEITFEEIHRNGAIAYAIMNYTRHTGDEEYLYDFGLEVLVAISRFWAQRVNYSEVRQKYVMLGVTGPNEYENNANNNWYTNYLAVWTLKYTLAGLDRLSAKNPEKSASLYDKINFNYKAETELWNEIINHMHFPFNQEKGILLQQDGYLDKEQLTSQDLKPEDRPINQNWSWDRILRSCFIKQADVLQGIYFFEDDFNDEVLERNFDFYEPRTVHESSLSPCIHVILASKLKRTKKAYELYLRTSRLDLDDYNHEVHEGCHITSMAGTWLSVVEGFGGMRVRDDQLHFDPLIPDKWESLSFKVHFRGRWIQVHIDHQHLRVNPLDNKPFKFFVNGKGLIAE